MILYHFVNAQYGLENIRKRRLKVARLSDLNDPFEFLAVNLSDMEMDFHGVKVSGRRFRKALRTVKEDISKNRGILCFSKTWENPIMWSHYADKHQGVCLGFEAPEGSYKEMIYEENFLEYSGLWDEEFMEKSIHVKFKQWEYEQEHRLWVNLEKRKRGANSLRFVGFADAQLKLTHVIIGMKSKISPSQVSNLLGDLADGVDIFKTRLSFKSFKVVKNQRKSLWK